MSDADQREASTALERQNVFDSPAERTAIHARVARIVRRSGVVAALVIAAVGCGDEVERAALPIADDFSGECRWPEEETEEVALRCEEGVYRFVLKEVGRSPLTSIPLSTDAPVDAVVVETEATLEQFSGNPAEPVLHGVACLSSEPGEPDQGYLFFVTPGYYSIVKQDETQSGEGRRLEVLEESSSSAVEGYGSANRVRGQCRSRDGRSELAMTINGQDVASVADATGFGPFRAFGFSIFSTSGTTISFDTFVARQLGRGD